MKFVIKRSDDGQFYFVIVARNGKVIATSEIYTHKRNMDKAIRVIDPCLKHRQIDKSNWV